MKVLIVGFGSIGKRHYSNLRRLSDVDNIVLWRQNAKVPPQNFSEKVVFSAEDALAEKPTIAIVANPAHKHIETCSALVGQGVHVFVEKPLSHSLNQTENFLDVCSGVATKVMVGYILRFSKLAQFVKNLIDEEKIGNVLYARAEVGMYLPDWRPDSDYRKGVSANKELGGGAVLELSHEIDLLRWFLGEVSYVSAKIDRLTDLEIDVEDNAEIILNFQNGAVGSLHLDMHQRSPRRRGYIAGTDGTIEWDFISNQVSLFTIEKQNWEVVLSESQSDRNEMYVAELNHFIDCVKLDRQPLITVNDGVAVLKIVDAIKSASHQCRQVAIA